MGRPKGGTNREWSKEQKLDVLIYFFDGHTWKETIIASLITCC